MNITPINVNCNENYARKNQKQPNFKQLQIQKSPEMKAYLLDLKRKYPDKFTEFINKLTEILEDTKIFNGLLKVSKSRFGNDVHELVLTHPANFVWPGKQEDLINLLNIKPHNMLSLKHSKSGAQFYKDNYILELDSKTQNNEIVEYFTKVKGQNCSLAESHMMDSADNRARAIRDLDYAVDLVAQNSPYETADGYFITYHPFATQEQLEADLAATEASKIACKESLEAKKAEQIKVINLKNEPEIDDILEKYGV